MAAYEQLNEEYLDSRTTGDGERDDENDAQMDSEGSHEDDA